MRAQVWGVVMAVGLMCGTPLGAGITEEDLPPPPRPPRVAPSPDVGRGWTRPSRPALEAYVEGIRQRLQAVTASIQGTGLVEVKLTIRRNGQLAFAEVVPLDGPVRLREEVLQHLRSMGPLPAPPVSEDLLLVRIPLETGYAGEPDGFGWRDRP